MTYDTINDAVTMQKGAEGTLLAERYRVVRQLGQGGMGSVWLAEDTQLDNRQFAIKMLPSILVSNKRAYRQLKDEAIVAMQLVHPNIVQIRAFEENNGNPFLVMDHVDGQTLDDYLADNAVGRGDPTVPFGDQGSDRPASGGLPESDVIRLLKPIAAALDYAHSKGVVHRDVKPANVMIRKDGHPFILDFGIAREMQETMTRVTGKLSSGTLLYMSPEQLNGDSPKPAQDVYSFAAMAYECLKGEPPFVRGAIEDQIKNKVPDPPAGRGDPAAAFVAGIMAGLAKKPEDRPKSCMEMLEGDAVAAGEAGIGTKNADVRAGMTGRVVGAILGCVVVFSVLFAGLWLRPKNSKSVSTGSILSSDSAMTNAFHANQKPSSPEQLPAVLPGDSEIATNQALVAVTNPPAEVRSFVPPRSEDQHPRASTNDVAASSVRTDRIVAEAKALEESKRRADAARTCRADLKRKEKEESERRAREAAERKAKAANERIAKNTELALEAFAVGNWSLGFALAEQADKESPEIQTWLGRCYDPIVSTPGFRISKDFFRARAHYARAEELARQKKGNNR